MRDPLSKDYHDGTGEIEKEVQKLFQKMLDMGFSHEQAAFEMYGMVTTPVLTHRIKNKAVIIMNGDYKNDL